MLPELDILFELSPGAAEAAVSVAPDGAPIATRVVWQPAHDEAFPADTGNYSLTKGRPRFSLRLDHLGVDDVPPGTEIIVADANGPAEAIGIWHVEATDRLERGRVAHVIVRRAA